jgi:hypothetical protein
MPAQIDAKTLHNLDVQGFDTVSVEELAPLANWLRLPYVFCAGLAFKEKGSFANTTIHMDGGPD